MIDKDLSAQKRQFELKKKKIEARAEFYESAKIDQVARNKRISESKLHKFTLKRAKP